MGNIYSSIPSKNQLKDVVNKSVKGISYYTCFAIEKINKEIDCLLEQLSHSNNNEEAEIIQNKLEEKLQEKELVENIMKEKDLDDYTKEELVKYIQTHEFNKLDLSNNDFIKILKDLEIESDELLPIEIELNQKIFDKLKTFKKENENNQDKENKSKFSYKFKSYVKPKFTKEDYLNLNNNVENNNQEINKLSFELDVPKPMKILEFNPVTLEEFNTAFKENKSTHDMINISKQHLSICSEFIKYKLINAYNSALKKNKELVNKFSIGRGSFIYKNKKGDLNDVKSFRQIVSIPIAVNHLHRILALRLNKYFEDNKYMDTTIQKGGVSNITTPLFQQILKLKNTIKNANKNKKEICVLFVDISDAFPSMKIERVCEILEKYNVDSKYMDYIKNFYNTFDYYLETKEWKTDMKKWNRGLLQGCPLSALLFVITFTYLLKHLDNDLKEECGFDIGGLEKILMLAYIDDVAFVTKDYNSMVKLFNKFTKLCDEFGLKININKTKYMHIDHQNKKEEEIENVANNINIEKVDKYKYLGEYIYINGKSEISYYGFYYEIKRRLEKLDNSNLNNEQKQSIVTKILIPLIQRKFTVLYDIDVEDKKKIIKYLNKYLDKWDIKLEKINIDLVPDIQALLADTDDKILKNIELVEEVHKIKEYHEANKINVKDVKFNYNNDNMPVADEDNNEIDSDDDI